jgi:hypothetical protein
MNLSNSSLFGALVNRSLEKCLDSRANFPFFGKVAGFSHQFF